MGFQCHTGAMGGAADHDRDPQAPEAELARRKAALAAHQDSNEEILLAAEIRDEHADARDRDSADRDRDADRDAFTSPDNGAGYGADLPARRHAAMDRLHSGDDRRAAARDRTALTDSTENLEDPEDPRGPEGSPDPAP